MKLDELKAHCLKTLKQTEKFPTKTFEEHALVLQLIENQTSVIEELEKIKEEIGEAYSYFDSADVHWGFDICRDILDKHIAELKGEKNG